MSARYIWNQYEVKAGATDQESVYSYNLVDLNTCVMCMDYETVLSNGSAKFQAKGTSFKPSANNTYTFTDGYVYYVIKDGTILFDPGVFLPKNQQDWDLDGSNGRTLYYRVWYGSSGSSIGTPEQTTFTKYTARVYQGSILNQDSTSSNRNAYPDDNFIGDIWYKYSGYDDPDPTAVSYNKTPEPGKPVTVIVTPGQGFLSGDGFTISYTYQYSTDGGSTWKTAGKNTSTQLQIQISSDARYFQARVLASDSLGYVSDTYVYGQSVTLNTAPGAPSSLTVPPVVYAEKSFSISWSPAVDAENNLSGYQVQVSYNGGSSWSSSTNVSGTTYTTSVPRGNNSFRFRVRAYDTGGLYSAWTTSSTIEVRSMRAYVGINNKARKINEIYVGVNGKARHVIKGYIGVSGKARKFL